MKTCGTQTRPQVKRVFQFIPLVFGALVTAACDSKSLANNKSIEMPEPVRASINGYKEIKFGSSFEDAIGKFGGDLFNSAAVSDCFKDIPLKGCSLMRNMKNTPFELKEGIPYTLSLSFNRKDKLTDIGLNYDREGDISRAQCLEIHERTLDWLVDDYGLMRGSKSKQDPGMENRTTAGKNAYGVASAKGGFFITQPMRTVSSASATDAENQPIPKWNDERYVSLLSTFIVVDGNPICNVNAELSEPEAVERASYVAESSASAE